MTPSVADRLPPILTRTDPLRWIVGCWPLPLLAVVAVTQLDGPLTVIGWAVAIAASVLFVVFASAAIVGLFVHPSPSTSPSTAAVDDAPAGALVPVATMPGPPAAAPLARLLDDLAADR